MKDLVTGFLKEADIKRIDACVTDAERTTRGEIVVLVAPASHHYPSAGLLGAAAISIPLAVGLTRIVGPHLWAGPHDLWFFLGFSFPLFFLCRFLIDRLPPLKRLFVSKKELDQEVREAARSHFLSKGLYRTREETGVLVYLSVFERRVWVLADRGVDAVVPTGLWQEIVDRLVSEIREGRPADALCRAVGRIRAVLAEKLPAAPADTNELPNLIVEP